MTKIIANFSNCLIIFLTKLQRVQPLNRDISFPNINIKKIESAFINLGLAFIIK